MQNERGRAETPSCQTQDAGTLGRWTPSNISNRRPAEAAHRQPMGASPPHPQPYGHGSVRQVEHNTPTPSNQKPESMLTQRIQNLTFLYSSLGMGGAYCCSPTSRGDLFRLWMMLRMGGPSSNCLPQNLSSLKRAWTVSVMSAFWSTAFA